LRSTDVGLRNDQRRVLVLCEIWNTFGDLGAAARSTNRKKAEAEGYAISIAADRGAYRVAVVWVVRATARNRALLRRYPELFAARFPGSSVAWCRALTEGTEPPLEAGLVWYDVEASHIFPWRRRSDRGPGETIGAR
jgi:hypothetical protein